MSNYTLQNVSDDLAGVIHGKTVNKITNILSAFRRAANNTVANIDPDEMRIVTQLTIYDQVSDYLAPTDIKEKGIVDLRPQGRNRNVNDNFSSRMSKDANLKRLQNMLTVMDDKGLKFFRLFKWFTPGALTFDALDEINGWTATASAQNLSLDSIIYTNNALQFDIAAGANPTTGYIQSTKITSVDLTNYVNKSSGFFELYIPTQAILNAIVSVGLLWGNDTTHNYARTVTTPHLGTLKIGKNLMRFDWNGATPTGVFTPTAVDTARITITTNGTAISGLIVSKLFFSIGRIWDLEYFSKNLFNNGGTWSDVPADLNTTINLDTASYNIYFYEVALACLQQIQGKDALADRSFCQDQLYGNTAKDIQGAYNVYKDNNPDQREKVTQTWYSNTQFRRGFDRYRRPGF